MMREADFIGQLKLRMNDITNFVFPYCKSLLLSLALLALKDLVSLLKPEKEALLIMAAGLLRRQILRLI